MSTYYFPFLWLVIAALAVGIFAVTSGIGLYWSKLPFDPRVAKQLLALRRLRNLLWLLTGILVAGGIISWLMERAHQRAIWENVKAGLVKKYDKNAVWTAPDWSLAERAPNAALIAYGRNLIANTQEYFGENGLIRPHSINGLNCQNCHLEAGTKAFGNNYSAVASTYPQMRSRSGTLETIPKRVNDCFERSLNGQAIDSSSHEMEAIVAYIEFLGMGVPKGEKPKGAGLVKLAYLDRAADPLKGKTVFDSKCVSCHGPDGQGGLPIPGTNRQYPPLWGPNSYNQAAGLYRLSRLASYVKANMPLGAGYDNPQLSDEEAWDVAAYINAQPHPKHPFLDQDWPNIAKKPADHPFGPYKDTFPEIQHKFGPFGPIEEAGK